MCFAEFVLLLLLSLLNAEVAGGMERLQQLSADVRSQAESRRDTLHTMIDLAGKVSACRTSLTSGLSSAKHVFGRLEPETGDCVSLEQRRTALQVSPFHRVPLGRLGSQVVSMLDSGSVRPGFKSQSRRCRVTVLGKLFTPIVPVFTKQQNW